MLNENLQKEYRVSVFVSGIKKRCRKMERHHFSLGYAPLEVSADLEPLKEKARDYLKENMKSFEKAHLDLNLVECGTDERGVTIERWTPFGEGHIKGISL